MDLFRYLVAIELINLKIITFTVWSVLSPHTIGTTLLNAPVPFSCSNSHRFTENKIFKKALVRSDQANNTALNQEFFENDFNFTSMVDNHENLTKVFENISHNDTTNEEEIVQYDNVCVLTETENNSFLKNKIHFITESTSYTGLDSCPYVKYDTSVFTSTITTEVRKFERLKYTNVYCTFRIVFPCTAVNKL